MFQNNNDLMNIGNQMNTVNNIMSNNMNLNNMNYNMNNNFRMNNNIRINDNTGFISQAERQCVNARIQGGAASMSKRAMINAYNSKELNGLGFRLLIAVHDELIGECPIENKEKCKELLTKVMIESALPEVTVPMKCDTDDFPSWYYDVYSSEIKKEYNQLQENLSTNEAYRVLLDNHAELLPNEIDKILL